MSAKEKQRTMQFTMPHWSRHVVRLGLALSVLLTMAALLWLPSAQAASVGGRQNVSNDDALSALARVAQDPDGNVHVIWDSQEGNRRIIRYAKGTWNGSSYDFGSTYELDNVSGYQYATPNIAVAPTGQVLAAWSDGAVQVKSWDSHASQPSGNVSKIGNNDGSRQVSIAADSSGSFHIVWNGNFKVQYCQWNGSGCQNRDSWSSGGSNRPDVAVDNNNAIHVIWDRGQGMNYRARAANSGWGSIQDLGSGNYGTIAADGQGNVYLAWSNGFNIKYCRRTLNSGCNDQRTFSEGSDFAPSLGATGDGNVLLVWRETEGKKLWFNTFEGGNWGTDKQIATGPTDPDVSARSYSNRLGVVWSLDWEIQLVTVGVGNQPPPPTPTPPPPPAPPTGTFDFANTSFQNLWTRTDSLVQQKAANYSWIWGPAPFTQGISEYYVQSPGQARLVQYFDKSRMEINQPDAPQGPWYITNGRLTDEMITGMMQTGDAQYEQRAPAAIPIAGDIQNTFPLYSDLKAVYQRQRTSDRANELIYRAPDGSVKIDAFPQANDDPSMLVAQRVNGIGIPTIFWDFMNRSGQVNENGAVTTANPLIDWRFVVGEPLTEAYWTFIKVGGVDRGVLVQAFERRVLTYTPSNPPDFMVEMGNIGRHYFQWRYGVLPN